MMGIMLIDDGDDDFVDDIVVKGDIVKNILKFIAISLSFSHF